MKLISVVFSTFILLLSCENESNDNEVPEKGLQKWQLVRMTGSFPNSESTGDDMEWQEFYLFRLDSSFVKSRTRDGKLIEATGTYEKKTYGNQKEDFLELTYNSGKELVGSCYANDKEELIYRPDGTLSGTWQACDGPGLDYKRVKN